MKTEMPDDLPFPSAAPLARPVPDFAFRDDALARAATEVAAPQRRLVAGLRDAHAETSLRITALRRMAEVLGPAAEAKRPVITRLLAEAEEQLRRLELIFAWLRERPTPRRPLVPAADSMPPGPLADSALAQLLSDLAEGERQGARDAAALRDLAQLADHALAARLLDLTAAERAAAAAELAQRH